MTEFLKWLAAPAIAAPSWRISCSLVKAERKFRENLKKKSQLKIAGSVN
jgi:hypothetical protein